MASLNISLPEKVDTNDPEAVQKLNSYLYKLSEEIRYMFSNLTPEDNYNSEAYLKFVQSEDTQAKMEISLKQIELSYVPKDGVISSINLSEEGVRIKGKNVYMEGAISANNDALGNPTFSVDVLGHMHATSATFSGDITASTITGSTFQLNRGANVGFIANGSIFQLGDFAVHDWYGRQILESTDEVTGMSGEPNQEGGYYLWAGWTGSDNTVIFCAKSDKSVRVNGSFYYNGEELETMIRRIAEEYADSGEEEPEP